MACCSPTHQALALTSVVSGSPTMLCGLVNEAHAQSMIPLKWPRGRLWTASSWLLELESAINGNTYSIKFWRCALQLFISEINPLADSAIWIHFGRERKKKQTRSSFMFHHDICGGGQGCKVQVKERLRQDDRIIYIFWNDRQISAERSWATWRALITSKCERIIFSKYVCFFANSFEMHIGPFAVYSRLKMRIICLQKSVCKTIFDQQG